LHYASDSHDGYQSWLEAKMSKPDVFRRSPCPVANTLDVIGDKWSLLVIRDMLRGKRTYGELADSPEGIPTNILADRLRRLEEAGIIVSSVYQERPVRYAYALSAKGLALQEVLRAVTRWGKQHIPGTRTLSEFAADKAGAAPTRRSTSTRAKAARTSQ
jgi:DNA-binding HxlR family transcriptional regulator